MQRLGWALLPTPCEGPVNPRTASSHVLLMTVCFFRGTLSGAHLAG
jgi:hypothetical protein